MQAWALGGAGALVEGHPHLLRSGDDGLLLCSVVVIRELGLQAGCDGALVHGLRSANEILLRELPLEAACADGVGTVPLQSTRTNVALLVRPSDAPVWT